MSIKLQSSNTTLIILGYGFGDEHINNLIAQSLINEDFNLIILNSTSSPSITSSIRLENYRF